MGNIYEGWLDYLRKEESATTGSLKLYYRRLKEELGDIFYYVFAVCNELGVKPEDIMWQNRNKLRERYAITSKLPPNCT